MSENYVDDEGRWSITVQLRFKVDDDDTKVIFDDDTEVDFIHRAWSRFVPVLESLVEEDKISSYRVDRVPHREIEKKT